MTDLDKILSTLRRRAWLLVVGVVVGVVVGYIISSSQTPTYEASTKLLVSNQLQGKSSDFAGLTNPQLVLTYIQLLKTKDLQDKASEKAGLKIYSSRLTIQQVPDTQIIEIRVSGDNSEEVATIANTMATTLLEQIESVRSDQYENAEATLTTQIEQTRKQIDTLQADYDRTDTKLYQDQLTQVEKQITSLQTEITTLQKDIVNLSIIPTVDHRAQIADKEARVVQLQSTFKLYDELRTNLIILGKPTPSTKPEDAPQLQQIKSTIDLYQTIYTDLLSNLEANRLAQSQQTPNILQIQKAYASEKPVAPIPSEYAFLSGVAGLILAGLVLILLEMLHVGADVSSGKLVLETRKAK